MRVKLPNELCVAQKKVLALQDADFRSRRIDFHITELWQIALG
jgi:hypothetical protein